MKIAIFSDCFLDLTGGIKSTIEAQKAALEQNGHTVYVFSTGYPRTKQKLARLAREHIFLVPSCRWLIRGLTPISRRPKIIERWVVEKFPEIREFDIIYVHYEAGCSIAGLRLARELGIASVQIMHGREDMGETNIMPRGLRTVGAVFLNWLHGRFIPHPKKVKRDNYLADNLAKAKMWEMMVNHANFADAVITPSEHFRQKLIHYGATPKIQVVPNGFPDRYFPEEARERVLEPGRPLKIIWHSRISAEKRMMPFLRALNLVQGKYRMEVFGGGGDAFRAKRYARRHHLPVKFYGNADFKTVYQRVLAADLDVLVSDNFDTFGMTLIEAEAAGAGVMFSDPDFKEIVPEGSYMMAAGSSPEEMAEALEALIAEPERVREMSRVMLAHREEVLASRRVKKLEEVFRGVQKD